MSNLRRHSVVCLLLVAALAAIRLGVWQLNRLDARRAENARLDAGRTLPELMVGAATTSEDLVAGRQVTARGRFLGNAGLLLRNRAYREAPGVHVVTRFQVDSSPMVFWVLRGFALAVDGIRPDSVAVPRTGTVTIRGELVALPVTDNGGQPVVVDGDTTWRRFDAALAAGRDPRAAPYLLYLAGGSSGPGRLAAVDPPARSEGPHFSYALQWFGIAAALLAFSVLVVRRPSGRAPAPPDAAP